MRLGLGKEGRKLDKMGVSDVKFKTPPSLVTPIIGKFNANAFPEQRRDIGITLKLPSELRIEAT